MISKEEQKKLKKEGKRRVDHKYWIIHLLVHMDGRLIENKGHINVDRLANKSDIPTIRLKKVLGLRESLTKEEIQKMERSSGLSYNEYINKKDPA